MPAHGVELSASDFDRQWYPGAQARALSEEPRQGRIAGAGRKQRQVGLEIQHLEGDFGDLRAVHVGGIAHHQVETAEVERRREVGAEERDAVRGAEPVGIPGRHRQGAGGQIDRHRPGAGDLQREGHREDAGAGADVEDPGRLRQPQLERHLHEMLGLRPWDQHPRVDGERPPPELPLAGQVGDRLAGEAARQEIAEPPLGFRRHRHLLARQHLPLGETQDMPQEQPRFPRGSAERGGRQERPGLGEELADGRHRPPSLAATAGFAL